MSPEAFSLAVAVVVFAGAVVGLVLQRSLPEKHMSGSGRDTVGAIVGLFTLLSALVLGLLIWTSYGVYSGQTIAVKTLAAKILQLDLALTDYGSDASAGRAQLRQDLERTVGEIWSPDRDVSDFAARNFAAAIENMRHKQAYLATLEPSTDAQKQAKALAAQTINSIGQARLDMSFALASPVSYPLVFVVLVWAIALFCGYGLMSRANPVSVIALAFGALGVASAFYLIIDLSAPYSGYFRASPAPIKQVLDYISRGQGAVGSQR
jgi:hypothetical protein